ncbi:UDP-N-acetylmuramate--L-alanine ligase [Desulfurobacterium thermolithotrophum DSM 11699]|uniref:UDP-N-acetylmuramate--L-alanine ligase n=1 Tax=Desulfurobacterium thermolithotrophum (strain DSM 11699 / BSA) TaxID=868864 RepID=F0S257_DESTD|nr:UDP-N-acetylmuramate--L-alanine ligase [Desulfurobacterium thermolithotrophum]ADY73000.1 UDP-N-acetylmuramate--L-alanine ligase [Desulfurobacterium thermolithotrophum DSM 11699]
MIGKLKIHIVGIGGIGMSGIALILKGQGYEVQGSDIKESSMVKKLREEGIRVFIGHKAENVHGANLVIHSSAVKFDNVELQEAKNLGIPVIPRADILSDIMRFKEGVAVAGTHGKTTTSSMIATIFHIAGLKPTILVGGRLSILGGVNAQSGDGNWLVAEADESDGTFLKLTPTFSVITNIDADHVDYYGSFENLKEAFLDFANRVSFYGKVFLCGECQNVKEIVGSIYKRKLIYGFSEKFDLYAKEIVPVGLGTIFDVYYKSKKLGRVKLNVPGKHNILNALGAIGVSLEVGVSFNQIAESLEMFRNANRRMELKGTVNGITFIDDYAHHPTEIETSYKALKSSFPDRRIVVLFQPHRFSRTNLLWKEFVKVLKEIDNLFISDIYPAGEKPIKGINAKNLARECGAVYCGSLKKACRTIKLELKPGDVFLSMGAGDVTKAFELITGEKDEQEDYLSF